MDGLEAGLGTHRGDLSVLTVATVVDHGTAVVAPETEELVLAAAEELVAACGMSRVELDLNLPIIMGAWSLTRMMRRGVELAEEHLDLAALVTAETRRTEFNEAMADMFEQADIVIAATNNGALTTPSNIFGNSAISLLAGVVSDGLPVGMRVLAGRTRSTQRAGQLSIEVISEKLSDVPTPSAVTAPMATSAMSTTSRAYSTRLAPRSSWL